MTATTVDPALLACEVAVLRALELAVKRAGLRLRANGHPCAGPSHTWHISEAPVPSSRVEKALAGAWAHLRTTLADDADVERLILACDEYTRALLADRVAHDRDALAAYLQVAREAG
ncbi:hypothetical protein FK268_12635 [Tsukamurella sputi]|uniref:Uncharacterized protein n=1 Tax=Tsukamurella sputi TaxID=2591848 RepID=A0A5C5RMW7_9ACTN|nr:hypothetical protein [Tsukamurella sputi]TWS24429.1 hypothetical protein FK268_12635 [Tsukamurella sputi]